MVQYVPGVLDRNLASLAKLGPLCAAVVSHTGTHQYLKLTIHYSCRDAILDVCKMLRLGSERLYPSFDIRIKSVNRSPSTGIEIVPVNTLSIPSALKYMLCMHLINALLLQDLTIPSIPVTVSLSRRKGLYGSY